MHLIATIPGGWSPGNEGVFVIDQQPGDIVFITAADTEISLLNQAYAACNTESSGRGMGPLPSLRMANAIYLKKELSVDHYTEQVIAHARLVICRLLGGAGYYTYLIEAIRNCCEARNIPVLFIPGYEAPDWELMQLSSHVTAADGVWRYFSAGGDRNLQQCLYYLFNTFFQYTISAEPPERLPDIFIARHGMEIMSRAHFDNSSDPTQPVVPVLVYSAHYLAGNLHPVQLLCRALEQEGLNPMPVFVSNLRDRDKLDTLFRLLATEGQKRVSVIIQTTSFSTKSLVEEEADETFFLQRIGVPVIQAIMASVTHRQWEEGSFGLSPTDIAINIALPEIDGRIISTAISFKEEAGRDAITDSGIVSYKGSEPGCRRVAAMAKRWTVLQGKSAVSRRVALIMPNYPNKDSRLANGVGLDTPASVVALLHALQQDGYETGAWLPVTSGELMQLLTAYITNDETSLYSRPYQVKLPVMVFTEYCRDLSPVLLQKIQAQWGNIEDSIFYQGDHIALPGCVLGNIYVGIQPARGYNADPQSIYHSPDLPPTYEYLAFYCWLHHCFKADAIVHTGKHGNLEWLPGKSVALDTASCFPAAILPDLPHFYPFIINDPGEGTQAKRRNGAVIIDHLVPPMARAEIYGALAKMESLTDEYYEASGIDPKRASLIRKQLQEMVKREKLEADLQISGNDIDELLLKLDGYLCELKEAQIRDGLHILGQPPQGEQLTSLLVALHRLPAGNIPGITQALATDRELGFDPLNTNFAIAYNQPVAGVFCRTIGDATEQLELIAHRLIDDLLKDSLKEQKGKTTMVLDFIRRTTLPRLYATTNEIHHLLQGLQGKYVPSGPSGAPTRGGVHLLPTGRNFYSVDVRCIPTETAYQLGEKSARLIIDRYLQEHGEYPQSIGISVWGTSTMRTGGDDIAQALALLGVKPVWQAAGRRVTDFEILSLMELRRPRVDVTLRISGFFRDAFPDVISLFNAVIEKVAQLNEPPHQNPVRKRYLEEKNEWQQKGLTEQQANQYALFRVFGSRPGAYGVGLQALIDEKNWKTRDDLAMVYMNWSAYAYGANHQVLSSFEVLQKRLGKIQVVMHNQDNREHDILDSDDYYQFQGGMASAVEMVSGQQPQTYFGDHSRPHAPTVRSLHQELLKVYRSRVINPKWIKGMQRHGYKGAFEMAATVDYLFAYSATTGLVDDFMFEGIAQAYLINEANRQFIAACNPHALKDMAERMLEAMQRGLWKEPGGSIREQLETLVIQSE